MINSRNCRLLSLDEVAYLDKKYSFESYQNKGIKIIANNMINTFRISNLKDRIRLTFGKDKSNKITRKTFDILPLTQKKYLRTKGIYHIVILQNILTQLLKQKKTFDNISDEKLDQLYQNEVINYFKKFGKKL